MVQIVEEFPLRVDRRLAGVEILRLARCNEAAAEARDVTRLVVDGKHEPGAEPRPRLLGFVAFGQEPGVQHDGVVDAERGEIGPHEPDLARRKAQPEAIGHVAGDGARDEILARWYPKRVVPQYPLEVHLRCGIGLPQGLARIGTFALRFGLVQLDAALFRHHAHRRRPVNPKALLQERKHIARFLADKAVIELLLRRDREIPVHPLVKGTWTAVVSPPSLERNKLADDGHDVRRLSDALHFFVGNHSSTSVTPVPPSFQRPTRKLFTRVSLRNISDTRSRRAPVPLP